MIAQFQSQCSGPLDARGSGAPAFALLLIGEVALFAIFDGCFFDGGGIDLCQAHDTRLFIFYRWDIWILQRRHVVIYVVWGLGGKAD